MQKIAVEEFDRLKREFDELYNLIIESGESKETLFFADGVPYSDEEVLVRMGKINDELLKYDLSEIPADRYGNMMIFVVDVSEEFKGLSGTGANLDFSLMSEIWDGVELGDVRGCNLINFDFNKVIYSDKNFDEEFKDNNSEFFLERPEDKENPKNEAIDRFYAGKITPQDVILLKDELSDESKVLKWPYSYRRVIDKLGVDKFIAILEREPVYVETFLLNTNKPLEYFAIEPEMSAEEIIEKCFSITRDEIENNGIHTLTRTNTYKIGSEMQDIDVTKYGENFIKSHPEFFVEDRDLPEEIKQKFYNDKLTVEEFLQYEDEFKGIMVGIGIKDRSNLRWQLGRKKFDDLINIDAEAILFLQDASHHDVNIVKNILESADYESESFKGAIDGLLRNYKIAIFNNDIDIKSIENKFFRDRLPELFLDEEAPDELKVAFYDKTLSLDDLRDHSDWINWLKGKEEYVKKCCIKNKEYREWARSETGVSLPKELEEYMSLLYNSEIRDDRLKGNYLREEVLKGSFRERNPDLFYDDLPAELKQIFIQRNYFMDNYFDMPREQKELLRGKEISMLLMIHTGEAEFCRKIGGSFEAFEIYEKYRGILDGAISEIQSSRNALGVEKYKAKGDIEEIIKFFGLKAIERGKEYGDNVPVEFKIENKEYFLDASAPEELKHIFYSWNGESRGRFSQLANFEVMHFLKGKDIQHFFDREYSEFFEFCDSQELALELGIKYGDEVAKLNFVGYSDGEYSALSKEEILKENIYRSIENRRFAYNENMPEDFKNQYPDLFLSQEELNLLSETVNEDELLVLKKAFYESDITFQEIRDYPVLKEILKNKNLSAVMQANSIYLLDFVDGNKEKFLNIGEEYGSVLTRSEVRDLIPRYGTTTGDIEEYLDELLHDAIVNRAITNYMSLASRFQDKYPELFLLPEDLEKLDNIDPAIRAQLKLHFYNGKLSFSELKENPEFKEIIKTKNINVCMLKNESIFMKEFTELVGGDKDKAFNLASGRFATQLDELLRNGVVDELNIDKILAFYKEMKFIPHPVVVRNFPTDRVKDFALNSKLWGKLMSMPQYNSHSDYISSMLEAAMVMGVFETKEFVKNGETRVQGAGQEGFEKLQKLLNHSQRFESNPPEILKQEGTAQFVGHGYVKTTPDFEDELIYEMIERQAIDDDLIDELIQGSLTPMNKDYLEIKTQLVRSDYEYFIENGDGTYSCKVDRNSYSKIKVMFDTIGIKDDSVLSEDEFRLVKSCNRDFISQAFVKTEEGYKFNMAKIGDSFVIGDNTAIDEKQSKENKKLYDYVKFLMMEYGLEAEGAMLGANNDRSNIDLVLDSEKMEKIMNAADEISERALRKYSYQELWKVQEDVALKTFRPDVLHQVFDGLDMVYSKEFREFLLENVDEIALGTELKSKINPIQKKIMEIAEDPDYAEVKITPEVVLRAMSDVKFLNKKVGFEKGEELAQKFVFSQEYFDEAQSIWDEAKKRDSSSIPRIKGRENEYSYEVLRLDDAVGIFVGNITHCCQKVGGIGETAMLHSMKEKNGRVFVVRDSDNKVIAQSWLWRNGNTICFDNVEVPDNEKSQKNEEAIYTVLKKAAKELCDKDSEVFDGLIADGKIDKEKAEKIKVKKVTVGKGNTDIDRIRHNSDSSLEDKDRKHPIEIQKRYIGVGNVDKSLYVSDSLNQVVLYEAEDYTLGEDIETLAIHYDENIEKSCRDITRAEMKTIESIECEIDSKAKEDYEDINTVYDLASMYGVEPDELKLVMGSDWFMLYSENEQVIEVHKMLRSPSSGIMKKSVKEQKKAVKMIMDKATEQNKSISMESENDRVYEATKVMIKHAKKDYEMTVNDEELSRGHRIEISGIEGR